MTLLTSFKNVFAFLFLAISIPTCDFEQKWHQPETPANFKMIFSLDDCDETKVEIVKNQMVKRLEENRVFYQNINPNVAKNEITLDIIKAEDKTKTIDEIRTVLIKSAKLMLVRAVRVNDKVGKSWVEKIKEEQEKIESYLKFNEVSKGNFGIFSKAVLGVCSNENLPQVKKILSKYEQEFGMKFCWGPNNQSHVEDFIQYDWFLYAYLKKEEETVTSKHIKTSSAGPDNYSGEIVVNIEMDEEGAENFASMTKKAAYDGNREILIMINEEVYSAPMVNDPILGGRCTISGSFDIKEAADLAFLLKSGPYACVMKLISEDSIGE